MKTLQCFNVYQRYGGEENIVRALSDLMRGPHWEDLFFHSNDWAREPLWKKLTQPLRAFHNPAVLRAARAIHARFQPDVWLLHNVLPVGSLALYHLAHKLGAPVIQYIHNYRPFSPGGTAWHNGRVLDKGLRGNVWPEIAAGTYRGSRLQTLFASTLLKAYFKTGAFNTITTWLAPTQFQKERFAEAGVPAENIEVLLPPRQLSAPPEHWREDGSLLFLGRLVPEKGILFLLDQWEEAQRTNKAMPDLVIAGTGPLEDEVRTRVGALKNVRFVGHVDPEGRQRLLAECTAVVVPSLWWEVMGMVVFEAYEMEKPVLATRIGGLGEIVLQERTGFQFAPDDRADFHQALQALLSTTPERRQAMGRAGRAWLQAETDPKAWRARYLQVAMHTVERKRAQIAALPTSRETQPSLAHPAAVRAS